MESLKESIVIEGEILKIIKCINYVTFVGLRKLEHLYIIPKAIDKVTDSVGLSLEL